MHTGSAVLSLLALAAGASAAQAPLGLVERVDGTDLTLAFEADPHLLPGTLLAIYAPGSVERHPLTGEVMIQHQVLVAKAQALEAGADARHLHARVLWVTSGAVPATGDDCIALAGEAAPNSPPVLTAALPAFTAPGGCAVAITLPIADPDGDVVSYRFTLIGSAATSGRLDASTHLLPQVVWTAPASPGSAALEVQATDAPGHTLRVRVPLTSAPPDLHHRDLGRFCRWGGDAEPAIARCARLEDGSWLALATDGARLVRLDPGWQQSATLGGDRNLPSATALAVHGMAVWLAGSRSLALLAPSGQVARTFSGLDKPSDIAITPEGVVAVADQAGGGVALFEPDGRFRARLGRPGDGGEDFGAITRLAIAPSGELLVLDAGHHCIHRFDRFQRRLTDWTVPVPEEVVDLAVHPRGVLLLGASGAMTVLDERGQAHGTLPSLGSTHLVDDPGSAAQVLVDASGMILVTYPERGLVARYSAQGPCTGVRGAAVRERPWWAADARGGLVALDGDGHTDFYDAEGWLVARRDGITAKHCQGLAVAADGSWVELLDRRAHAVVRISGPEHTEPTLRFGQEGKNPGQFDDPAAIAVDDAGRTYVLDKGLYRVSVFDPSGAFLFAFGSYGRGAAELKEPLLLAVEPGGENAYVYDDSHEEIKKFALDFHANSASHRATAGGHGDGPGQLRSPLAVVCDRLGLLYLVDHSREDLQVLDFHGSSPVVLWARRFSDLGVRGVATATASVDGAVYLAGDGQVTGLRWTARP